MNNAPAAERGFPKDRDEVYRHLVSILGKEWVLHTPEELIVYECDGLTLHPRLPDFVVFPTSTEEVVKIVKLAWQYKIPFLPRGAGTSLSGGAIPVEGGIVLEFSRMNRILSIDYENRLAVVQPGVVNLHVTQAAKKKNLYYAPDPSSQMVSTIGGNVAENAGGPHTLKYGVTTNHVTALEVVLPDGEVYELGTAAGDAVGYDLVGSFVGSEGTFGIVTQITVRLLYSPPAVKTMLAVYDSVVDATKTVSGIIARGVVPAALEMIDRNTIQAIEASVYATGIPKDAEAVLLIEIDGLEAGIQQQMERILEVIKANNAREIRVAQNETERKKLWAARKNAFGAYGRISANYYTMDGVIPRSKLPQILQEIDDLGRKHGLRMANVFHAGDGNLHPIILYDINQPGAKENVLALAGEILQRCVEVGGALSGEHGIGLEKQEFMSLIFSEADLHAMQQLKRVFNPENLANPSKIFPIRRGCRELPKNLLESSDQKYKAYQEIVRF
ncbi:MAG: FAD-binding oxidoreductase [Acidobacteria bacterium]|nr:MAG: FAD-binding oxidoreductase [Acidobacteriota bacterium]